MDADTLLVLGLFTVFAVLWLIAVGGSIDALTQPREAWDRAGFRRNRWVWQVVGVVFLPVMLAYSGAYFVSVRPRLVAAARDLAIEQGAARAYRLPVDGSEGPVTLSQFSTKDAPAGTRFRQSAWTYLLSALTGALLMIEGFFIGPWYFPAIGIFVSAATLSMGRWVGVTLTDSQAILHALPRRRIPWSQVQAVTQESVMGSRRVVLWTASGRRPLRAPTTFLGLGVAGFERDFHAIGGFWLAHRGPDSTQQG